MSVKRTAKGIDVHFSRGGSLRLTRGEFTGETNKTGDTPFKMTMRLAAPSVKAGGVELPGHIVEMTAGDAADVVWGILRVFREG